MNRLLVLVEGQTERRFVRASLAPMLALVGVYPTAPLIGKPGHKGGVRGWQAARREILAILKQGPAVYCSTMFDYFGMPLDWPGRKAAPAMPLPMRADAVETALHADIVGAMGAGFDTKRFIPYIEMHEFEAMLFSDCQMLAGTVQMPSLANHVEAIFKEFSCPEAINDGPETAPSKRILKVVPHYDKVLHGSIAAERIGLAKIISCCPHFGQWVTRLAGIGR